jgi:hypothetical protein
VDDWVRERDNDSDGGTEGEIESVAGETVTVWDGVTDAVDDWVRERDKDDGTEGDSEIEGVAVRVEAVLDGVADSEGDCASVLERDNDRMAEGEVGGVVDEAVWDEDTDPLDVWVPEHDSDGGSEPKVEEGTGEGDGVGGADGTGVVTAQASPKPAWQPVPQ